MNKGVKELKSPSSCLDGSTEITGKAVKASKTPGLKIVLKNNRVYTKYAKSKDQNHTLLQNKAPKTIGPMIENLGEGTRTPSFEDKQSLNNYSSPINFKYLYDYNDIFIQKKINIKKSPKTKKIKKQLFEDKSPLTNKILK